MELRGLLQRRLGTRILQGKRNLDVTGEHRKAMAKTHLADIRTPVAASGTTITEIYRVGPIVAAFLVGYSGDITRFESPGHYASYNATAPHRNVIGRNRKHRLSLPGNRKLNHAIHMAAVTQIHNDTPDRVYYDKKRAEGKTKKEALRALKRRVSDAVYGKLTAEQI